MSKENSNSIVPTADSIRYTLDDKGVGNAFADSFKNELRFVREEKNWYYFDGTRWRRDTESLNARERAKKYLEHLCSIAHGSENGDFVRFVAELASSGKRKTMLDEAKSVHPLSISDFDTRGDLLNCLNGTIDLNTCERREHNPSDLITKLAPVTYDENAKCLRWLKFIDEIMCNVEETRAYLQKWYGYGITGETSEECLLIKYGPRTRNGKGTLDESVMNVLGDYALNMQPDSLAKRKRYSGSSPSPDIARNVGVRFVNVNEPAEDMVFDAAILKQLTGSDTVTARFLYGSSFDFVPRFKLFISTNHLPTITDDTLFASRRIWVIPFSRHFNEDEQDKGLKTQFKTETSKSAILNWMLEGLMMYRASGLEAPEAVKKATAAYRQATDTVGSFIENFSIKKAGAKPRKTSEIYLLYKRWCRESSLAYVASQKFVGRLRNMGHVKRDGKIGNVIVDLEINYS